MRLLEVKKKIIIKNLILVFQSSLNLWHHIMRSSYFLLQGEEKTESDAHFPHHGTCVSLPGFLLQPETFSDLGTTKIFSAQKNNNNNNINIHLLVPSLVRLHLGDCETGYLGGSITWSIHYSHLWEASIATILFYDNGHSAPFCCHSSEGWRVEI